MSSRILAIDTTTEACSVAVLCDGEIISRFIIAPREHTQKILPMIQEVLWKAEIHLKQLDVLAFSRGPGSFSGVRISIGIAQGLAVGVKLPMIGISSLMTLAEGAYRVNGQSKVLVAIDARMLEIYCAQYQREENGVWFGEDTEAVMSPQRFKDTLSNLNGIWGYAGNGWTIYPQLHENTIKLIESTVSFPRAQDMLPIAERLWLSGKIQSVEEVKPIYLRNEVTWKKLPGR
ncbi:tRNA threonylcarbamoyladenosine biosynthesis protein TsaB [Candidatus Hartigia pinicola]|nr:tRNA threonylcarbamoyladenosine biosynthesis protein TsaB [Candidatus Hartigia pinicola]